jgi:hypothetical protein
LSKFRPKKVLFPICSELFNSFMFIHCHIFPLSSNFLGFIHCPKRPAYPTLMCRFFALSHFPIFIHCLSPLVSSNVQFLRIVQLRRVHSLSKVPLGFIQCKISKDSSIVQLLNIHPLSNTFTSIHYPTPLVYPSSHFLNLFVDPFSNSLKFMYYPTSFNFIHYPSFLYSFVAKKSKDVIMYFTSTSI